jgi:hypothetical protein
MGEALAVPLGTALGLVDACGVALAVVAGAVDTVGPHETAASTLSGPSRNTKKLPRWKRTRGSSRSALLRPNYRAGFVRNTKGSCS